MTYGRYRKGATLAYRLDPRTKMAFVLVLMVSTFLVTGGVGLAVLSVVAVGALVASGLGVRDALAMLRPFVWLMAFVLAFNGLFASAGLVYGMESVLRFVIVLLGTSALMVTTTATELTDGVSLLLAPLGRLGLPTDDLGLAVGMTLRFVPTLLDEFERVRMAQLARHARLDSGRPLERVRAHVPVLVPTFASALRRSRTLALALENRGYGLSRVAARTRIRTYRLHGTDMVVLMLCVGLLALGVMA